MKVRLMLVLIAFLVLDGILEKRFPKFCRRIEFPCLILASAVIVVYVSFLLYGVYVVLTSSVSRGDKVFFALFIACIVAVYGMILTIMWKKWRRGRNNPE